MHFNGKQKYFLKNWSQSYGANFLPHPWHRWKKSKQVGRESTNMFVCLCIWI